MGLEIRGEIDKVNGKELSYNDFADNYLAKNRPVVLTGLMDDWRACKDWVNPDGQPNLEFFSTHFPKSRVQVADCGTREFTDQKRVDMTVAEFIASWVNKDRAIQGSDDSVLYLKDWHFVKDLGLLFMLMFSGHIVGQRTFVEGRNGSFFPLLKVILHLTGKNLKTSVYNILDDVIDAKYPGFKKAVWLTCTQEEGEIIFVPSGWYHQVHNLEDTISINHNWFNGHNLSWVFNLLVSDYKEAKEYIEDIRDISDDFEGLCQRNLAANTGMNFVDFFIFLLRFFLANLVQVFHQCIDGKTSVSSPSQLTQHFTFNLSTIRRMAVKMEQSVDGLAGYPGFATNLRETLDDPEFIKLCIDVGKAYGTIHNQMSSSSDEIRLQIDEIVDGGSHILRTKGFVKFTDFALEKLSANCFYGKKFW
ncbi:Arginine-specific demethylase JMJ20 [Linum perenne]